MSNLHPDFLKELAETAQKAFDKLSSARAELFAAAEKSIYYGMVLDQDKAQALAAGRFDGKNAEIREAQATEFLSSQINEHKIHQNLERAARLAFDLAQIEVDAVKTHLRILELAE